MAPESELLPHQCDRILGVVDGLATRLDTFLGSTLEQIGRTEVSAAYVAQVIEHTYTALETLFLLDYDWARLDYLCGVYRRVIPLVKRDLAQFRVFLERILP